MQNIVVSGSIAYDYLMQFPGRFVEHIIPEELHQVSLSFLVEEMTKHWGGVAANIAYTMARLGLEPKLMGTVGRDFRDYDERLRKLGVDTTTVRQFDNVFTASFFCNTDQDNNQIASFYSGAMEYAHQVRIADVMEDKPDLVIISPNDPRAMKNLAEECRQEGIRFIYDPSQQIARLDGDELRQGMEGSYAMIVNAYEAGMICEKTGTTMADLRAMIDLVIVTRGGEGSTIYTNGDEVHIQSFAPTTLLDPTGAGDAFRAGFVTGLASGFPLKLAGEIGALCATYDLEHVGTQSHNFTIESFIDRFRTVADDGGQLDRLLV